MPIVVVTLKGRELQRVPIRSLTTTIGRDHHCDIFVDNAALSRHHATIHCHRGMFGVRDEGSANGIFVNGQRVQGCRLNDGDEIALGKFRLHFQAEGGPPIDTLREAGSAPPALATSNPEQTTAISLVDLQRMAAQKEAERAAAAPTRAERPARRPPRNRQPQAQRTGQT